MSDNDRGMVLLESALAIPLLVMVALVGLGIARVAVDEVAVVAVARDAAVQAGRGASSAEVTGQVQRRLPAADVVVTRDAMAVTVRVSGHTTAIPWFGRLAVRHEAVSVASREPEW